MNRNRQLSEKVYGPRHVQPHQPAFCATKKKKTQNKGNIAKQRVMVRDR